MNEVSQTGQLAGQLRSIDRVELKELRAAQERARELREEAIARERVRLAAFAAELSLTSQEMQSLLPLKRRKKAADIENSTSEAGESEGN